MLIINAYKYYTELIFYKDQVLLKSFQNNLIGTVAFKTYTGTGYMFKHGLDSFSGIGDQKAFPWFMWLFGIKFPGNHQINVFCIQTYLFIVVIGICAIAINIAIFRQIKKHVFHSINIMKATCEHGKLNRYPINSSYYLNKVSIEIFSDRSFITPELIPLNYFGSTDMYVFTDSHREAVNNIFRRYI